MNAPDSSDSIIMKRITEHEFDEKYHILEEVKVKLIEEVHAYSFIKKEEIELELEFYECTLFDDFNNIVHICAKQKMLFGTYYYMIIFFETGRNRKLLNSFFYVLNDTFIDDLPFN